MSINDKLLKSAAGAGGLTPSENFKVVTYTGNSSSQAITGVGFKPDLVWIKERSEAENHNWIDSTRGTSKILSCNLTGAEFTSTRFTSFDTDGFTLANNNETNDNGVTYVAWCWKANGGTTSSNGDGSITTTVQTNTEAGFSFVKYSGNGSVGATIGHNLGAVPNMFAVKKLSAGATNWRVYHTYTDATSPQDYNLEFNGNGAKDNRTEWNDTMPTSSVISLNAHDSVNASGSDYICYSWTDITGFSKFGSYTGNESSNGPIVETGFEVGYLMIKESSDTSYWSIYDNVRNTSNPRTKFLKANSTDAEATDTASYSVDFLSNGFQIKGDGSNINEDNHTYIYMAFATDPDTEVPELASSFNVETYTGTNAAQSITGLGFSPGMVWWKNRTGTNSHAVADIVRGANKYIHPDGNQAQNVSNGTSEDCISFDTDGFSIGTVQNAGSINTSGGSIVAWTWKANDDVPTINDNGSIDSIVSANANAGFSIVQWTGTGANATVGHGLSSAPDVVIVKNLDSTTSWLVYHSAVGATKAFYLETTNAPTTNSTFWNDTAPTATTISIGTHSDGNASGDKIIAYCFHDVTGYSKFGSYTGDGNAGKTITTGFKPDWILIKSTVGADNWRLYDTLRGIKGGGYLEPNRSDADDTSNAPSLDIKATGFEITSGGVTNGDNANGNLYTYYAFAKNVASNTTLANSFKAVTYTGTGSGTPTISGVGFRPDLVWIKDRSASHYHILQDSVRTFGSGKNLNPNNTNAQGTDTDGEISSTNSDGFVITNGNGTNNSGENYVAWCWKAGNTWQSNLDGTIASTVNVNTAHGFSVVHWYGTQAAGATVGHGLGAVPEMIIVKRLDYAEDWGVYHSSLGNTKTLNLNTNDAEVTDAAFNDTTPTSSVFTLSNCASGSCINSNSGNYIAYCWTPKSGFSKFGTYTGTGSSGNDIDVGFQPDFVMMKRTDDTGNWQIFAYDGANKELYPNLSDAEYTSGGNTINSDGFAPEGSSSWNVSSATYIYMAFKAN